MLRTFSWIIAAAVVLSATATLAQPVSSPAPTPAKRLLPHKPHWGVPPGYVPPEQYELQHRYDRANAYWYGGPGFYQGRWNGGGFGPCWTKTPIGPIWNCGR